MLASIKTGEPIFSSLRNNQQVTDWGLNIIMAPTAWKQTKGEGVKVAILDTGIDANHPDLADNIRGGINFTTSDRNDWQDRQGHGTHCAGIVAGTDNNIGVVGVAPKAELYAVKVLGDDGRGSLEWINQGVEWCIANNIDVISMSLGTTSQPPEVFREVFKKAEKAGIPVVAASGNENQHVGWPAAYPETISVAAMSQTYERAVFSNFGDENDVIAPGVQIYSTYPGGRYAKLSGTSMATPMVSGALALVLSKAKKEGRKYALDVLKQKLYQGVVDLGQDGDDDAFGHGLINLAKLLG